MAMITALWLIAATPAPDLQAQTRQALERGWQDVIKQRKACIGNVSPCAPFHAPVLPFDGSGRWHNLGAQLLKSTQPVPKACGSTAAADVVRYALVRGDSIVQRCVWKPNANTLALCEWTFNKTRRRLVFKAMLQDTPRGVKSVSNVTIVACPEPPNPDWALQGTVFNRFYTLTPEQWSKTPCGQRHPTGRPRDVIPALLEHTEAAGSVKFFQAHYIHLGQGRYHVQLNATPDPNANERYTWSGILTGVNDTSHNPQIELDSVECP